jgi:4'-phosphopantetheinyl transferase
MADVDVLFASIEDGDVMLVPQRLASLQKDERARFERLRSPRDRALLVAGRGLIRYGLRELFGVAAAQIAIGAHHRPELSDGGDRRIDFNLAHAAGVVACGFSRSARVGVDVERLDDSYDVNDIAAQACCADEHDLLMHGPATDTDRRDRLFRLWTLKEAVVKATGLGLQLAPDQIGCSLDPPRLVRAPPELGDPSQWRLQQWAVGDVRIALAIRARDPDGLTVSLQQIAAVLL